MNGPSETATLPTPVIQTNGGLFPPYHYHHHHNLHGDNRHFSGGPGGGHYSLQHPNTNGNYATSGSESLLLNKRQTSHEDIHVTVLQIDQKNQMQNGQGNRPPEVGSDFVTVLKIVSTGATILTNTSTTTSTSASTNGTSTAFHNQRVFVDSKRGEIEEEVTIYRLPGERLGMALRFDGGQSATETIRRVFVQSITLNSPSAKAIGLMLGMLREGDEILQIDGRSSSSLTRLECITLLRDAPVCIRLLVRRSFITEGHQQTSNLSNSVPNISRCCQMLHLPNDAHPKHNGIDHHSQAEIHYSSAMNLSSSNPQLLNYHPESISMCKKVPPPVPPRMATTTLSSKRKSSGHATPMSSSNESLPHSSHAQPCETTPSNQHNGGGIEQQPAPSSPIAQVEKPPRRKNLHNVNQPPPLPPRRPKGPPPKPPTEKTPTTATNFIVTNQNNSSTCTATTKTLVTVISTKVSDVTNGISPSPMVYCSSKIETTCSTTPSSTNGTSASTASKSPSPTNHSSKTARVTFNISNSKVSSFIRHTAEKLHRRLSGKTISSDEDENVTAEGNHISKSPTTNSNLNMAKIDEEEIQPAKFNTVLLVNKSEDLRSSPSPVQSPAASPLVGDFNQDPAEESFESDTDDTSSSVSTIIERGSFFTNPLVSQLEQNLNRSVDGRSIVDRVLSPFERLDGEHQQQKIDHHYKCTEAPLYCALKPLAHPAVTSTIAADTCSDALDLQLPPPMPQTSAPPSSSNNIAPIVGATIEKPMSSKQTSGLVHGDEERPRNGGGGSPIAIESPNSIPHDTDIRRDQSNGATPLKTPIESNNCGGKITTDKNKSSVQVADEDDEDEDLDAIKNDIFSRLSDDKDDFMIDTEYLEESSSRFLFHHNSSELVLNSYSELSSITEEDEEDETGSERKIQDARMPSQPPSAGARTTSATIREARDTKLDVSMPPDGEDRMSAGNANGGEFQDVSWSESHEKDLTGADQSAPKVSLNNVFEFLNKAADDFEFVERMLELTNDKIDSIDDIMRIRESLRGLQESEKRENLQRFLDGKDVFEELIALSSSSSSPSSMLSPAPSSPSTVSSPDNEDPTSLTMKNIHGERKSNLQQHGQNLSTFNHNGNNHSTIREHGSSCPDGFVSLPICLSAEKKPPPPKLSASLPQASMPAQSNKKTNQPSIRPVEIKQADRTVNSKIPTLLPTALPATPVANSNNNNLNSYQRSQSITNIYTRSNGQFSSLIETRPSLIPRPISNFNLSLPTTNSNNHPLKPSVNQTMQKARTTSHNCLNRSTSMQSIFSTNSLSRAQVKNNKTSLMRRQASMASANPSNYHQHCLKDHKEPPSQYYGSLSRSMSKSSTNVYSTGSLPRPLKPVLVKSRANPPPAVSNNHFESTDGANQDFRTTSLTDLTYGLVSTPNGKLNFKTASICHHYQPPLSQHHYPPAQPPASAIKHHHYSSSGNLYLPVSENNIDSLAYHSANRTFEPVKKSSSKSVPPQYRRISSSLASLLPSGQPAPGGNSHFWHCSNHQSTQTKRTVENTTFKNRSTNSLVNPPNKSLKATNHHHKTDSKQLNSSSGSSSSSSSSSNKSDGEETVPLQSILRTTDSKTKAKDCKSYWNQRKSKPDFEANSDSEGSDITVSSGDSNDYMTSKTLQELWPEKRHRSVCFMDQVSELKTNGLTTDKEVELDNGELTSGDQRQREAKMDELQQDHQRQRQHPYLTEPAVLSSSTSTSSISSLGSSTGEAPKSKESSQQREHRSSGSSRNNENKSYFLSSNTHREDSGIFASDDTASTSEFSQSPSPELMARNPADKAQEEATGKSESTQSIKDRIAFFSLSQTRTMPDNSNRIPTKSLGIVNGLGQLSLSRSSSAPCETVGETQKVVPVTPSQSPPDPENESIQIKRMEMKETTTMRDSIIMSRRHQNICKLKGLIIPELDTIDTIDQIESAPIIGSDLPMIINQDNMIKMPDIEKTNLTRHSIDSTINDQLQPIEIIPLKPANVCVPKYSPMFKRRTLSLPVNNYPAPPSPGATPKTQPEPINEACNSKPLPAVQPKPRTSRIAVKPKENPVKKMSIPPPLPPKSKEPIDLENPTLSESTTTVTTTNEEISRESIKKHEEPVSRKIVNEFAIFQKQHSMRAIIFQMNDLNLNDEMDYLKHLGIKIKGGFDSDTDTVTVENIEPDGLAAQDGRLQVGDRIISINGKRLAGMTHNKILELLKSACMSEKVILVCSRPHDQNRSDQDELIVSKITDGMETAPPPVQLSNSSPSIDANNNNSFKSVRADISKDVTGLGFIIEGGKNSSFGDRPITIKRIFRGGPVDKEGTLLEGDELLQVNDQSLEEMTRAEAWNFLKQLPDGKVSLVARRRKYHDF